MSTVLPPVTVVIPCRNDAALLEACLQSLAGQSLAPREIVVVDNNSTDASAETARRFGARVVFEPVPGIPAAASAGYDAASGPLGADTVAAGAAAGPATVPEPDLIIARCDADCVLPRDWVQRIAESFAADPDLEVLSGPGVFYGMSPRAGRLVSRLYLGSYYLAMGSALAHWPFFGSNLALRARTWQDVSGQVHREDAQMHDDVCLSFHLGQGRRCRRDRSLVVGMAPRAVQTRANLALRFRRAFHTLVSHWPQEYPWVRWGRRFARG
ncbi:glycosyltransferase [Arthrobacter sp. zg-Y20]|uniref:glycosyltransferase family A protein n=1 Tax=unclassified Arthrobacter TaxID=235627 RepID=UPI001D151D7B|nr:MULTISPECIES: glycosyltransferase family A protein [unclassified Arthrobacter]MCC3275996.1 glycosyltransferase [Arthrobacter sp. zg-Y20]MDK1316153.1 glycosyltransferase family A protein [Arthrobacter sp. zg.Y20]WIB05563.1 glycosyltransferase family A protein [Arthrobacter sp. zg-Y20]